MGPLLMVTGTGTDVGKTVFSVHLVRRAVRLGLRLAVFKPFCSGGRGDAEALREEIVGPVRPVFKHRDISEVISFIPQGEKPLVLCIFSKSRVRIDSVTSA
jgi:dethiobiotin synthetase